MVATTAEKFKFRNELVLFVCSAFDEHEKGTNELVGSWDAVGFIALTFGDNIISAPIFSAYFKLAERKFCNGEATVVGSDERENNIYGLKGFYDEDKLDATDAKTHAALWFVGRAFSEKSSSIKIIFYYIALEIICGKRSQDYLRRFYRGDLGQLAADEVRMIKGFRDDLVHRGHVNLLNKQAERKIQTIILDVIVHEKTDTSHFAFQHICSKN